MGFQPWTCWSFWCIDLDLVTLYVPNIYLFDNRLVCYCELRYMVWVCHTPMHSIFEKKRCGVSTLTRIIIFANSYISLVGVYILKRSWIRQQRSMLYLKFGVRFYYVMHHYVQFSKKKSIWISNPDQDNHFRKPIYLFLVGYI